MLLDFLVLSLINQYAASSTWALPAAVVAASVLIWVMAGWYAVAVWRQRQRWYNLVALLGGGAAAYAASAAIGQLWFRLRPYLAHHATLLIAEPGSLKSFPSDHATAAFFLAVLLTARRRSWWWSFVLAALVAVGRVAVGVHYPTDILAGALLGSTLGLAALWLEDLALRRRS